MSGSRGGQANGNGEPERGSFAPSRRLTTGPPASGNQAGVPALRASRLSAASLLSAGGPQVSTWADMQRAYLHTAGTRRLVISVPIPGLRAVRDGALLVSASSDPSRPGPASRTWAEFLAERLART